MAASEYTWVLTEILAEWRKITGISSTTGMTAVNGYKRINAYYRNRFPLQVELDLLHDWYTQSTAVNDDGKYQLAQTDLRIDEPVKVNNSEIMMYRNKDRFFREYPEDEQFITSPTLVVGTSDTTAVKHSDFVYELNGVSYNKSSSEVSFTGLNTVPQNKYGAFSLKIDSDGTITIAEADDNSTGYSTAGEAVEGLPAADSDSCFMGYVTVISTDSGGFVPGTTALSDTDVTDTYTDGKAANRGTPQACLIYDEYLYVRPKADRIMQIKAPEIIRPDALDTEDAPLDIAWGPLIALGSAIEYIRLVKKDHKQADNLQVEFDKMKSEISGKLWRQNQPQYAEPSFL